MTKRFTVYLDRICKLIVTVFAVTIGMVGIITFVDGALIKSKSVFAQILLERAWGETIASSGNDEAFIKPWPWADIWPVAKVEVPRLQKKAIVLSGVSGQAMAFGPGLMEGSPQLGMSGLAIMAAHRETHFRFLKHIKIGDEILVTNQQGHTQIYIIEETRIVEAKASGLTMESGPNDDRAKIALVTCWPFNATQQGEKRFVAIGVFKQTT